MGKTDNESLYDRVLYLEKTLSEQRKILERLEQDNKLLERTVAERQALVENAASSVRAAEDNRSSVTAELAELKRAVKEEKTKLEQSERSGRAIHLKYISAVDNARKLDVALKDAQAGKFPEVAPQQNEEIQKLQSKADALDRERRALEKKAFNLSEEIKKKDQQQEEEVPQPEPESKEVLESKVKDLESQVSVLSRDKDASDRRVSSLNEQIKKFTVSPAVSNASLAKSLQDELTKLQNQLQLLEKAKTQSEGKAANAWKDVLKLAAVADEKDKEIQRATMHLKSMSRALDPLLPRVPTLTSSADVDNSNSNSNEGPTAAAVFSRNSTPTGESKFEHISSTPPPTAKETTLATAKENANANALSVSVSKPTEGDANTQVDDANKHVATTTLTTKGSTRHEPESLSLTPSHIPTTSIRSPTPGRARNSNNSNEQGSESHRTVGSVRGSVTQSGTPSKLKQPTPVKSFAMRRLSGSLKPMRF
mmetsp:Transcript_33911/g.54957  ORF Transcript_33911/g.54957 Transcript_33911/m.54957 type:complete len:481 (+) Transcript_33911:181-1623(+)|eukprot:CAMPEP_0184673946 /NCGR_PEP_ID=MMETSP0308-20130426/86966_1 /TAXON_ID=38269 /ORGANISM="Gloeochaete witrockiana, Strain SAG 46.84" /LENGTH=480 /DNA_ID=CAMNT_0027121499 /DNA_START=155 /DNA_END=1597 /DNA_ORIENTATION=+